ncbi:hypothetical protein NL676_034175 [Syzygium grande]|nr:hypothetical protein NL676_034175 [Syzygium grande]
MERDRGQRQWPLAIKRSKGGRKKKQRRGSLVLGKGSLEREGERERETKSQRARPSDGPRLSVSRRPQSLLRHFERRQVFLGYRGHVVISFVLILGADPSFSRSPFAIPVDVRCTFVHWFEISRRRPAAVVPVGRSSQSSDVACRGGPVDTGASRRRSKRTQSVGSVGG